MSDEQNLNEKIQHSVDENSNPEGSSNPSDEADEELILGKFKSVDELKQAYQTLQNSQDSQSEELGRLRKLELEMSNFLNSAKESVDKQNSEIDYLNEVLPKYDNQNYFQNDAFKTLFSEAYKALGTNLDTDLFVKKLEDYVLSRILINDQQSKAMSENSSATDSLDFSKGSSKSAQKKLRFQDIPSQELEKYIAKYV